MSDMDDVRQAELAELLNLLKTMPQPIRLPDLWNAVTFRYVKVIGYINELKAAGHNIKNDINGYTYNDLSTN